MTKRLLVLALVAVPAWADDAGLLRCRAIAEPAARLACYDALVVPARSAPRPESRVEPRAPAPQAPPPQPAPMPQQSPAQFGFEQRQTTPELPTLQSHIPGRFEGWRPRSLIRLANGQVWQVTDETSRMFDVNDTKVTLRRGLLGSFFMDFDALGYTVRVRRVQ